MNTKIMGIIKSSVKRNLTDNSHSDILYKSCKSVSSQPLPMSLVHSQENMIKCSADVQKFPDAQDLDITCNEY